MATLAPYHYVPHGLRLLELEASDFHLFQDSGAVLDMTDVCEDSGALSCISNWASRFPWLSWLLPFFAVFPVPGNWAYILY